ncbi:apelin receptor 2 [Chanos chanos]|uniref:Apelin receptor 2 n=1 Tax=Chanos chanos TaxID=29144 RepID=A0A6J2WZV0_CHACN|nr:apelin receptor B-like [Chanos chanos]
MSESEWVTPSPSPSSSPFPQCDYSEWSPTLVIIPAVYLLAFAVGSFGNGLVLWVYLVRPGRSWGRIRSCSEPERENRAGVRPASFSRSITDSLIVSLAAADLAFVLTLPLWAVYTALDYHWPFGHVLCKLSSYLVALNMYASVFSLTGLSAERYWVIVRRKQATRTQGQGALRAGWIVGGMWALAGILALPALLLRTVREPNPVEESNSDWPEEDKVNDPYHPTCICVMDYSSLIPDDLDPEDREHAELVWEAALGLKSTLLGFLLPLAVLLLCYCSLGRLLAQHFRQGPKPDHPRQRRLLRVIITLVLAFFLCWLPFHTNKTISALIDLELLPFSCSSDRLLVAAHPYATCLGYINSCLNPLLYACCDVAFRRRCRTLLRQLWCGGRQGSGEEERERGSWSSSVPSGTREVSSHREDRHRERPTDRRDDQDEHS